MIETVRGKIDSKELGITMAHEHLIIDLSSVRNEDDSTFDDYELIKREVMKAKEFGVQTFVEVTCNDMGRDVKQLKKLSEECDVHIIASTGFYLDEYHSEKIKNSSIEELEEIFTHDLTVGIDHTNIKAGIIGEVASSLEMTESERKVLTAAARVANKVGCAVTTHCQMGKLALEQIEILTESGLNPDKIILGHLDLANDMNYYIEVLKHGVNIGFDTIGKINYLSDEIRADNLMKLIELGYVDKIVLSQDISRKSYLSERGDNNGYMTVMKTFIPLLKERNILKEDLNKLLIENPKRIFNI